MVCASVQRDNSRALAHGLSAYTERLFPGYSTWFVLLYREIIPEL